MKVAFVTSEISPFSKTGGLADVSGSLPHALLDLGVDVRVFTPLYGFVKDNFNFFSKSYDVSVSISSRTVDGRFFKVKSDKLAIYFLENDDYYDRAFLYGDQHGDYPDNLERFTFLSKAILSFMKDTKFKPDIIHVNDWQTSLIPVYLKNSLRDDEFYSKIKSLLTIHNIGYQGYFNMRGWHVTSLDFTLYHPLYLEFYGGINLLKGGIIFSDMVTTVSKSYAEEIKTSAYGYGLDGVLRDIAANGRLRGIINGIDKSLWNPARDKFIKKRYTTSDLSGKDLCRKDLLDYFSLGKNHTDPILGIVSRLVEQKGFDSIIDIMPKILDLDLKFVLLGKGEPRYENFFKDLSKLYPDKVGIKIGYSEKLAHMIEAGSDIFLMPSIYEPCGLNQLYSLAYGTVPIVRSVGGLKDTVTDYSDDTVKGVGFTFKDSNAEFLAKIMKALDLYKNDKKGWQRLMINGMNLDYSWGKSGSEYLSLYESVLK